MSRACAAYRSVVEPAHSAPVEPAGIWRAAIVTALRDAAVHLPDAAGDDARVHALRRAAKQVRALALLAPEPLDELARETRDRADLLRRSLGHSRDAAVRRETFAKLVRDMDDHGRRLSLALEIPAEHADAAGVSADLREAREAFALLASRWEALDPHDLRMPPLVEKLASTYRRARKRYRAAEGGDTRELHRWRRAVVDLDLQAGVFATASPSLAETGKQARRLRDLLGRIHDIDALEHFLAQSEHGDAEALASLAHAATRERQRLTRKAEKLGKRLLKRKTGAWTDRVAAQLYAAARTADAAAPPKDQQASV